MESNGGARAKSRSEKRQVAARQDIELRLAKAMAHPVRVKILEMINECPMAPVEASEAIGTPLSNVSYHFRTLLELDCIEAVERAQVRGSIKTTYRSKTSLMFDDLCFATLPGGARAGLTVSALKALYRRASDSIEAGTMDSRSDSHISVTTLNMRWKAWDEINKLVNGTLDRILEIKAEEDARENDEQRFPATFGLLAFESPKMYE